MGIKLKRSLPFWHARLGFSHRTIRHNSGLEYTRGYRHHGSTIHKNAVYEKNNWGHLEDKTKTTQPCTWFLIRWQFFNDPGALGRRPSCSCLMSHWRTSRSILQGPRLPFNLPILQVSQQSDSLAISERPSHFTKIYILLDNPHYDTRIQYCVRVWNGYLLKT